MQTSGDAGTVHEPVMVDEVLQLLQPERGGVFVDCTVGLGGHARALLERGAARVIGIDRDSAALVMAASALAPWGDRVHLEHTDYRAFGAVCARHQLQAVDGVVADLGVSSMQLEAPGRGFSFRRDDPLDMRMDTTTGDTVAERLAAIDESSLANVIYQFGEERHSRRIARAIVVARQGQPIATTGQLAAIVRRASPTKGWQRIDPATRTFQALRIWVNSELEGLDRWLHDVVGRLRQGGRLVVVTFQSLEDRVVKHTFRALARGPGADDPLVRILTKRPLVPGDAEVSRNPRARSAKLRAVERT